MLKLLLPDPKRFTTYHLFFTCYGTWLPGSEKGSIQHGGKYIEPNLRLESYMREQCKHARASLSDEMRQIVFNAIIAESQFHNWSVYALNVLSQHVHILISVPVGISAGNVMGRLKAAATRELHNAGFFKNSPVWTRRGNHRFVKTTEYFNQVYDYVLNSQTDETTSTPNAVFI